MTPYYIATLGRWAIVDGDNAAEAITNAADDPDAQDILQGQPPRTVRPATDAEICDWTRHWAEVRYARQTQKTIVLAGFLAGRGRGREEGLSKAAR